jgi:hypothetical protein
MKFALIIGALAGFTLSTALGLWVSSSWPTIVVNASAGALGMALLMRWWRRMWLRCLADALAAKHQALQQTQETAPEHAHGAKV